MPAPDVLRSAGGPLSPGATTDVAKIWVVIAAYNESAVIGEVVAGLRRWYTHVVVVDDGSSDGTGDIAHRAGAWLLRHQLNLGQGAALGTGLQFALGQGAELLVTFDADGQHRPEDIDVMIRMLSESGADVALGSRFLGAAPGLPRGRKMVLKLAVWFTRLSTGLWLTDTHNGLRALTRHAAETIVIRENRMAHASELISEIRRHRLSYVEVPVTVMYTDYARRKGQRLGNALDIVMDLLIGRISR